MASVFTYETDPVQVASPWPQVPTQNLVTASGPAQSSSDMPSAVPLSDYGIARLIAEPQEGPVEYKLHLMLRPRRSFSATSTVQKVSGSHLSKGRVPSLISDPLVPLTTPNRSESSTPVLAPSNVSRQNRLQHLTTQLLWRLQQSSPHHTSSKSDLILPVLPEVNVDKPASKGPGKLIAGLEESLGALYEIGVSDDGSFVGLTRDELDESLMVLRAMSYSLGCHLQVLRMVDVGDCQWNEEVELPKEEPPRTRTERLCIAEVLIGPNVGLHNRASRKNSSVMIDGSSSETPASACASRNGASDTLDRQLRVSLTGSTTSGKSSLLGTLSTSTLDNGRGKSRLSLLKHRHEIVSGVTSSLAQELIGYQDSEPTASNTQVVNYASANVSSWNDIHSTAHPGRLIFVTDSAGHPRYRRTTVRGVISWAPHWTLCCVAADNNEDNTGKVGATASASEILGSSGQGIDLSKVHLELCLKLGLPLVVVITKLDLASKTGLRQTLTKVLSTLKDAGRKPSILPSTSAAGHQFPLQCVSKADNDAARKMISSTSDDELHLLVPIVLTSAVTGAGISKIHCLLRLLPALASSTLPLRSDSHDAPPLFHIDEVFTMAQRDGSKPSSNFILSGYLRYGSLAVGDYILVGPFTADAPMDDTNDDHHQRASSYPGPRRSPPKSPRTASVKSHRASSGNLKGLVDSSQVTADISDAWQMVAITSMRYLRLPVRKLQAGQVATVAITFSTFFSPHLLADRQQQQQQSSAPVLRRGMVLLQERLAGDPPAYSSFTAIFKEPNTYVIPGSSVTIYTASIRTSAKIVEVRVPDAKAGYEEVFSFHDDEDDDSTTLAGSAPHLEAIEITFKFSLSREWIELGTQVLVTPASGLSMLNPLERGDTGGAGLDGFVGRIVSAAV